MVTSIAHLAVVEAYSKRAVARAMGGRVWTDHGRGYSWLRLPPEAVLTEDEVGEAGGEACGLTDTHLRGRGGEAGERE